MRNKAPALAASVKLRQCTSEKLSHDARLFLDAARSKYEAVRQRMLSSIDETGDEV